MRALAMAAVLAMGCGGEEPRCEPNPFVTEDCEVVEDTDSSPPDDPVARLEECFGVAQGWGDEGEPIACDAEIAAECYRDQPEGTTWSLGDWCSDVRNEDGTAMAEYADRHETMVVWDCRPGGSLYRCECVRDAWMGDETYGAGHHYVDIVCETYDPGAV